MENGISRRNNPDDTGAGGSASHKTGMRGFFRTSHPSDRQGTEHHENQGTANANLQGLADPANLYPSIWTQQIHAKHGDLGFYPQDNQLVQTGQQRLKNLDERFSRIFKETFGPAAINDSTCKRLAHALEKCLQTRAIALKNIYIESSLKIYEEAIHIFEQVKSQKLEEQAFNQKSPNPHHIPD